MSCDSEGPFPPFPSGNRCWDLACVDVSLTNRGATYSHIWDAIRLVWPDSQWAADDKKLANLEPRL